MFIRFRAAMFAALFAIAAAPQPATAVQLQSVRVTEAATLPRIRPDWPIPRDTNQLFYLQRSLNSNTIVFAAEFDGDGNLSRKNPAHVYWRRYNTTGERKPLKPIERRFAYGVNIKKRETQGDFIVSMKPLPQLPMVLRQTGPGKAELIATIGGRRARPVYAFVTVIDTGLIPKVTAISLHGIDTETGRAISEVFSVAGGAINQ
ncbi:MAG: DUF4833 domain-containing protein [Rhodobacter sp.]|jgi:hypothetical protein|nr:DUF4833 domain-containing protein [Rhodobacter sp.]